MKFCNKCGWEVGCELQDNLSNTLIYDNKETLSDNKIGSAISDKDISDIKKVEKKPKNKKIKKIAIGIISGLIILLAGIVFTKFNTDKFKAYVAQYEQEAKNYKSLGRYTEEYEKLLYTAKNIARMHNIFAFSGQKNKMQNLLKDVKLLKEKVDVYERQYNDCIDKAEIKNKFILDYYKNDYDKLKNECCKAIENLEEEESAANTKKFADLINDIESYSVDKTKNYLTNIKNANVSRNYFDAEKGFIKNAKRDLEEALKNGDYVKAEYTYNEFYTQKTKYDNIKKSEYFNDYIQIDASDNNIIKLYYPENNIKRDKDSFTVMEKDKNSEKWVGAKVKSIKDIQGDISIDLVVDVSSSMSEAFYDMKEAVKNFVYNTDANTNLGLSLISDIYQRENEFTNNKTQIANSIDSLYCGGLTSLYQSLYSSVLYTSSMKGARCVVAFTDGINEPYGVGYDFGYDDVIDVACKYKIPIYIISLGYNIDGEILNSIANDTGGRHYNIDSAYDLYNIYSEIYGNNKNLVELTYESTLSNNKDRAVYINYYDEYNNYGMRSEFNIQPEFIYNAYNENAGINTSNLASYYTKTKYISSEELSSIKNISDLQTLINIYYAKAGYKYPEGGETITLMKSMGVVDKNGTKSVNEVTATLRKNPVLWANFSNLFNYRYEWIYNIVHGIFYEYEGDISLEDIDKLVHEGLGEEKSRFLFDIKKAFNVISDEYYYDF